ncbi:MAG: hypothetical protein IJ605_06970 [Prevotella sp.]|nr:hypothetical protein [Prevotella sp.]
MFFFIIISGFCCKGNKLEWKRRFFSGRYEKDGVKKSVSAKNFVYLQPKRNDAEGKQEYQ